MAAHSVFHPSDEALRAFALGKLNDSTAAALVNHLDSCPDCCKVVAVLSGDDFLNRLRQAHGRGVTPAPAKALAKAAEAPPPPASQTPMPHLPPELAANQQYDILRELGRGGMGVVYLAKNKLMDRLEVLKVINKTLLDRPGAVERFLREIRSAAKLSHPNVVTAYSAVQQGDLLAFAMEYIEGQDLANVVKAQGPLPVAHACYYVQQAALGLQHAFEKGMVHRDIKPQNLILAREGKKHLVKVLDFGLAKATREKQEDTGLTGEGKMLGTPDYIAPEQSLDAAKADIRADIYSLGCTLYYLLSGRPPFSATSLGAILLAHQMQEAKPLNLVRPEVPEELAAIVRKMMAKDPAKRYQTPAEVVQALGECFKPGGNSILPKPSLEISMGTEAKSVPPPLPRAPVVEAVKQPPARSEGKPVLGETMREGSITSAQQRKSSRVPKHRAATVRQRKSPNQWLLGGSIGVGVLLLVLVGVWATGVIKEKMKEIMGIIDGGRKGDSTKMGIPQSGSRPAPPMLHPRRAWTGPHGKWSVQGEELVQEKFGAGVGDFPLISFGDAGWREYDFHLKAMRTAGEDGFAVIFDNIRPGKFTQWAIGASGNRETFVDLLEPLPTGLKPTSLSEHKACPIVDNRWYDILITTRGQWIECFLDGQRVFRITPPYRFGGRVGFSCYRMAARFKDIEVTDRNGEVLWKKGPPELP